MKLKAGIIGLGILGEQHVQFLADQPDNPRAALATAVARMLRATGECSVSASRDLRQAALRARAVAMPGDRVVVFGSFFTVAGILPLLRRDSGACEAVL